MIEQDNAVTEYMFRNIYWLCPAFATLIILVMPFLVGLNNNQNYVVAVGIVGAVLTGIGCFHTDTVSAYILRFVFGAFVLAVGFLLLRFSLAML